MCLRTAQETHWGGTILGMGGGKKFTLCAFWGPLRPWGGQERKHVFHLPGTSSNNPGTMQACKLFLFTMQAKIIYSEGPEDPEYVM